jgi:hypothetical protein
MAEQSISIPRQRHLKERASDEFKRFLVIFLYLWVVFGLLSIHKSFVLSQRHLDYGEHAFAFINAFVFAKVLLVAEEFNLGTRFRDKPLIYPVLHKCFLFTVVLIGCHVVEVAFVGLWHGHVLANSLHDVLCPVATILPIQRAGAGDWSQRAVGFDSQAKRQESENDRYTRQT